MAVLVAYGSSEGQTKKIAGAIAKQLRERGDDVRTFDTSGLQGDLDLDAFDHIIVAASVHEKRHQQSVEIFVSTKLAKAEKKPALFISVSLAAAFDDGQQDAKSYIDNFLQHTNWKPDQTLAVAGALRHGEYGYYKEQIIKYFVLINRDVEDQEADHEFTNWDNLATQIDKFMAG
jgi:menaquinone-dependent protoporphyrinogen oxidase